VFRYKRSVPVSRRWQGYIYYKSLLFNELPEDERMAIIALCDECGGEYADALRLFVTTETGATAVCMRHSLSKSTLYRAQRKFYREFAKRKQRGE